MKRQELLYNELNRNFELDQIQNYIKNVIEIRGFGNEPVDKKILLLIEEVGELAKAIRKEKTNMAIDKSKINNYDTIENEIADVFIVLNSICNTLDINLFNAFYQKEKINIERIWENDYENN